MRRISENPQLTERAYPHKRISLQPFKRRRGVRNEFLALRTAETAVSSVLAEIILRTETRLLQLQNKRVGKICVSNQQLVCQQLLKQFNPFQVCPENCFFAKQQPQKIKTGQIVQNKFIVRQLDFLCKDSPTRGNRCSMLKSHINNSHNTHRQYQTCIPLQSSQDSETRQVPKFIIALQQLKNRTQNIERPKDLPKAVKTKRILKTTAAKQAEFGFDYSGDIIPLLKQQPKQTESVKMLKPTYRIFREKMESQSVITEKIVIPKPRVSVEGNRQLAFLTSLERTAIREQIIKIEANPKVAINLKNDTVAC